MEPKKDQLEDMLEQHQKPHQTLQKVKEKYYQALERHPTLTAFYVKLTEFCYCLPRF